MIWLLLGLTSKDGASKDLCMLSHLLSRPKPAKKIAEVHPHANTLRHKYSVAGKDKSGIGGGMWLVIICLLYWGYDKAFATEPVTKPAVSKTSQTHTHH